MACQLLFAAVRGVVVDTAFSLFLFSARKVRHDDDFKCQERENRASVDADENR